MENQIFSRIQLKYDTLANWNTSTFILKKGEAAIVEVPQVDADQNPMPPSIGIKIGDGKNTFQNLPWIQAAAGDVFSWAKAATKPTYTANEIVNLENYISGQIADSNTKYRIVHGTTSADINIYYLQQQDLNTDTWDDVLLPNGERCAIDFTDIYGKPIKQLQDWIGDLETAYYSNLTGRIRYQVEGLLSGSLNNNDNAVDHQFVTAVQETAGRISVSRSALSAADIASGTFSPIRGGTGLSTIPVGEVLIGNGSNTITTKPIRTYMEETPEDNLITDSAIKAYVDGIKNQLQQTFTGAMHFKGIGTNTITTGGTENPFSVAYTPASGDVVLVGKKEYVWDGASWQELGDETSYVIRGSITNTDIASNAAISQEKIAGQYGTTLAKDISDYLVRKDGNKVLSTNDYTTLERNKLANIDDGAQVNVIEAIYVNNVEQEIDEDKAVHLTIDLSDAGTVKGARVPTTVIGEYEDLTIDSTTKKIEMARIAKTGDVADLTQLSGTVLVFNCGTASTLIE